MSDSILRIARLFHEYGARRYDGSRRESVSALEHALQCAQLAEWAGAAPPLVAAALLHDVGHFMVDEAFDETTDDAHELRALPWLRECFGRDVTEPVRLHVQAKRYLVATDPDYAATLSPASVQSLVLQGGPMTPEDVTAFMRLPHAADAVALRRWDDLAKVPGRSTPSLDYYLALVDEVRSAD
jgi:phosphonate degradation associated HDIG domain protein